MFQDYFEELPEIIDDENQETFITVHSLDQAEDKHPLLRYYCSLCGQLFCLVSEKISNEILRTEDLSIVFDQAKYQPIVLDVEKEQSWVSLEEKEELRTYYKCTHCGCFIFYQVEESQFLLPNTLV